METRGTRAGAAAATGQEIAGNVSQTLAGVSTAARKQLSKVEMGQRNLAAARSALEVAEGKVDGAVAKGALTSAAEEKAAARAKEKLDDLRAKVAAAEADLQKRQEKAERRRKKDLEDMGLGYQMDEEEGRGEEMQEDVHGVGVVEVD